MFVDYLLLQQMNHFWKCAKCMLFLDLELITNKKKQKYLLFYYYYFRYGTIASSKAIIDQKSGECKGYGFAMFENEQESEDAIEGLNKAGLQASFARVGQVKIYIHILII